MRSRSDIIARRCGPNGVLQKVSIGSTRSFTIGAVVEIDRKVIRLRIGVADPAGLVRCSPGDAEAIDLSPDEADHLAAKLATAAWRLRGPI